MFDLSGTVTKILIVIVTTIFAILISLLIAPVVGYFLLKSLVILNLEAGFEYTYFHCFCVGLIFCLIFKPFVISKKK